MLESMKHCVAMGGAVAACAAAAAAPPPGTAGGPPTTAGAGGAMFNALAATAGSSNPVPTMMERNWRIINNDRKVPFDMCWLW